MSLGNAKVEREALLSCFDSSHLRERFDSVCVLWLLWGSKMRKARNENLRILLRTKIATNNKNCSCLTPQTMVSIDTLGASHPYLPCSQQVETMADGLEWLLYAWAHAGWHQGDHGTTAATMVEKCIWRLILVVLVDC